MEDESNSLGSVDYDLAEELPLWSYQEPNDDNAPKLEHNREYFTL